MQGKIDLYVKKFKVSSSESLEQASLLAVRDMMFVKVQDVEEASEKNVKKMREVLDFKMD